MIFNLLSRLIIFLVFLVPLLIWNHGAIAKTYVLYVQQKTPSGETYQFSCQKSRSCAINAAIPVFDSNDKIMPFPLEIGVIIKDGYLKTRFVYEHTVLTTSKKGWDSFQDYVEQLDPQKPVDLYIPHQSLETDNSYYAVLRPPNKHLVELRMYLTFTDE